MGPRVVQDGSLNRMMACGLAERRATIGMSEPRATGRCRALSVCRCVWIDAVSDGVCPCVCARCVGRVSCVCAGPGRGSWEYLAENKAQ